MDRRQFQPPAPRPIRGLGSFHGRKLVLRPERASQTFLLLQCGKRMRPYLPPRLAAKILSLKSFHRAQTRGGLALVLSIKARPFQLTSPPLNRRSTPGLMSAARRWPGSGPAQALTSWRPHLMAGCGNARGPVCSLRTSTAKPVNSALWNRPRNARARRVRSDSGSRIRARPGEVWLLESRKARPGLFR